jgi:hypothetical protein
VAAGIRGQYGRGIAIVGQDHLRRIVLRKRDVPGGVNIGLIDTVARYSLDHGYHVIVEGILYAAHYGDMLTALRTGHRGSSWFYYLSEYGRAEMSGWYRERHVLPGGFEQVITEEVPLDAIVQQVMGDTGHNGEISATAARGSQSGRDRGAP